MKRTVGNIPNGAKFAAAARICVICINGTKRRKAKSGKAEQNVLCVKSDACGCIGRNGTERCQFGKRKTRMNQGAEKLMKPESNNESNNHESDRGGEGIRGRLERFCL